MASQSKNFLLRFVQESAKKKQQQTPAASKSTTSSKSSGKKNEYDPTSKKITASLPASEKKTLEQNKQASAMVAWQNRVAQPLTQKGRNLSPTADGRPLGSDYDAQFTDEYFEKNPEFQRWLDTDINTGAARDVGNMVDVLRRRQAGFNYRSQTESPDSRYKKGDELYIYGLPEESPTPLFPVIRVECDGKPETNQWGRERLWNGDPQRIADWASSRGNSVYVTKRL